MKIRPVFARFAVLVLVTANLSGPAHNAVQAGSAGQPGRPQGAPAGVLGTELVFEPAVLVEDVNTGTTPIGSGPSEYTRLGGFVYFQATHPGVGTELLRTNGTAAGTTVVADICPGSDGSNATGFVTMGGQLYFSADDCSNGRELWRSGGTAATTVMVRDIFPGASVDVATTDAHSSSPDHLTTFAGQVFFAANDGVNGDELWKTDGTYTGTVMVKDIAPGSSSSNISEMLVFSNTLYFVADGGFDNFGEELWMSDGSEAGTQRVTDISLDGGDSDASNLTMVDGLGRLFFSADDDATYGRELWSTNGSPGNAAMVKDINSGPGDSFPTYLAEFGDLLLFSARDQTGDTELWRSDGTDGGTYEIEIHATSSSVPIGMAAYGSVALLAARSQDSSNSHWLWSTDGITVTQVATVTAGSPSFTEVDGIMYFQAYDVDSNLEVWRTDGTGPGTQIVKDINPAGLSNPNGLFAAPGNRLIFTADNGSIGAEPWISDGTETGTELILDIHPQVLGSFALEMTAHNGSLYWAGYDAANDYGLWRSPDLGGATYVTDVLELAGDSPLMVGLGTQLLFQGDDDANGRELWTTDGTTGGTMLLKDIHASGDSDPQQFTRLGDTVYFVAEDADGGQEIWSTQGTEETTVPVTNINPGTGDAAPNHLTVHNGQIYFFADDGTFGQELWRTDGTTTTRLSDISPNGGDGVYDDTSMASAGGTLYFSGDDSGDGGNLELWQYDGASVSLAMEINPSESSIPQQFTEAGGDLYFVADDGTNGHELWRVSGGVVSMLADIAAGPASSNINNLLAVDGRLFFTANDGLHGIELWTVEAGVARMVDDIYPGTTGSLPRSLVGLAGRVIFAAANPGGGYELWQSDGTAEGTERI